MSVDLILRPSSLIDGKPWALQLRYAGPAETEYRTLARVTAEVAADIIKAGGAFWLFADPEGAEPGNSGGKN